MGAKGGTAGRVISGSARGVRLRAVGEGTRPLSDRIKQTLFAILEPDLRDARALDLFAGTGAGAIEALSRGAALAVLVERDPEAIRTIEANLAATRVADRARVVRADVTEWLASAAPDASGGPFRVVLVDPPYDRPDLLRGTLALLGGKASRLLAPDATVVAKHAWREQPQTRSGLLASVRERRIGETTLTFYRPSVGSVDDDRAGEEAG